MPVCWIREEGAKPAIQINYIDSYDYKVVVNIKIILQSFKERESERIHKHNRPNYVIDYKWSKLHLRVFYSHYISLLAVGRRSQEATIGFLFGSYLARRRSLVCLLHCSGDNWQRGIMNKWILNNALGGWRKMEAKLLCKPPAINDLKCKIFCIRQCR